MLIPRSPETVPDLPSFCHSQDSQILTKSQIVWNAGRTGFSCSDRVEVVVDRDAAYAHEIGDVLNRPSQEECPAFIEETHRDLFAGSIEVRHVDVMGSGRFFYASEPKEKKIDLTSP